MKKGKRDKKKGGRWLGENCMEQVCLNIAICLLCAPKKKKRFPPSDAITITFFFFFLLLKNGSFFNLLL